MNSREEQTHISIRRAGREDVPAIVRLLADDKLGSGRENYQDPLPEAYYAAFEEIDGDKHNELLVLEAEGEVRGTLQLTFITGLSFQGAKRAQIEAVRVDSRYRGQGLGRQLIQWTIQRARQENCRLVQLTTNNDRADAHRFYQELGFVASHTGMKLDLG
ncbi:MAG TPA: GNAT family N-acetyltransferase [Pyrinomonadaceae bacterium]|jgi:GNAT superfamily N-acetyltransferase